MRRMMMAAIVLLLVPGALFAQGGGRRGGPGMGMGGMNIARLLIDNKAEIALTDDQVAKLQVIADSLQARNAPFMEEMQRVRGSGGMGSMSEADRTKMRATMQALRTNAETAQKEIDAILTAEQKPKADAVIERNRPRRGGGSR